MPAIAGSYLPSRGSTIRVVIRAQTIVIMIVEPIPKNRFEVMSIVLRRVDEADRLVGDLGQDRVARGDQQVDAEAAGDAGERSGDAGQADACRHS